MAAGPVGATGPSKSTVPSADRAVRISRVTWRRTRSPGTRAAGSQTNVTRDVPPAPRETPNHGRMSVLTRGAGSGGTTRFGSLLFASSAARSASSGEAAQ